MNKEQRQRLSELIREIRGERSLRELARELEVSAVSVNSWEKGDSVPGIESLDAIAHAKGWTIYKLLAYLRGDNLSPSTDEIFAQAMELSPKEKIRLASLLLSSPDVQS